MKRIVLTVLFTTCAMTACAEAPDGAESEPGIVARYGESVVTAAELDEVDGLRLQLIALQQQEYDVKRRFLERLIFDRLVDEAAAARGVTRDEFLKAEVTDQVSDPPDAQIEQVVATYRARLDPDPDTARRQVIDGLRQQRAQQLQVKLQDRLFRSAGVRILLEPLRFSPDLTGSFAERGAGRDAPVTVVEYSDFQCPYCGTVQTAIDEIMERYGDHVRHVFKQLPLPMHRDAELAARASLCAQDQGRFWDLHNWMFANRSRIGEGTLKQQAEQLGLDVAAFSTCLDARTHADQVEQDIAEAQSFGITGTPGFLVNGRVLRGAQPADGFAEVIEDELRRAGITSEGAPQPEEPAS